MELDVWQPIAGLGLFLFAMRLIESALEHASGRGFRIFIRQHTDSPLQGVMSGTMATAVLQSSSLVGLMMLALVGAGVVEMRNALSVIFGANLGTTITGWIVATIGFKLDLEALSLPLIGIGGILFIATRNRTTHQIVRFGLGLGLLLMGLEFLKGAVGDISATFDVSSLAQYSAFQFLIFGVIFTAIVQSSSASIAVTLSALYGGVIDLPAAAAIAIGADLGTTTTVLLGAVKGTAAKKRVAAGHLLFNIVTATFAFVLLTPLLGLIVLVGISDPLISLVAFHSLFNLMGLVLFLPVIGHFATFLERRFADTQMTANRHLDSATAALPEPAVEAVELETAHLLQRVIRQNLLVVEPRIRIAKGRMPVGPTEEPADWHARAASFADEYQSTKQLEGEILEFTLQAQSGPLEQAQSDRIDRCQRSVREAVHASKSLKDIHADLSSFESSPDPVLAAYGQRLRDALTEFYLALYGIRDREEDSMTLEDVIALNQLSHRAHEEIHSTIYNDIRHNRIAEAHISSLLNANRELFASCRSLIGALAVFTLTSEQLETLDTLPSNVL